MRCVLHQLNRQPPTNILLVREFVSTSIIDLILLVRWNERRHVAWANRPQVPGHPLDGPFNGPPPQLWEIQCQRPAPFTEPTYRLVVPHTEESRFCWRCHGQGRIRCPTVGCHRGRVWRTVGTGDRRRRVRRRCHRCHGRGHVQCYTCE